MDNLCIILKTLLLCNIIYGAFALKSTSFMDMKKNLMKKIPIADKKNIFFKQISIDKNNDGYIDNYEAEQLFRQFWTPDDIDFFMSHCEELDEDEGISIKEFDITLKLFTGIFRRCGESRLCRANVPQTEKKEL